MSTRSRIAVQGITGRCKSIYCHFDGYPTGVGATLYQHYNSAPLATALVALGSISSLEREIGQKHDFNWRDRCDDRARMETKGQEYGDHWDRREELVNSAPEKNWCNAYVRDRGDDTDELKGDHIGLAALIEHFDEDWCAYLYLWSRGAWWMLESNDGGSRYWSTLHDVLSTATVSEYAGQVDGEHVYAEVPFEMVTAGPEPFRRPTHSGPITKAGPVTVARPSPVRQVTVTPAERTVVTGRSRTIIV